MYNSVHFQHRNFLTFFFIVCAVVVVVVLAFFLIRFLLLNSDMKPWYHRIVSYILFRLFHKYKKKITEVDTFRSLTPAARLLLAILWILSRPDNNKRRGDERIGWIWTSCVWTENGRLWVDETSPSIERNYPVSSRFNSETAAFLMRLHAFLPCHYIPLVMKDKVRTVQI